MNNNTPAKDSDEYVEMIYLCFIMDKIGTATQRKNWIEKLRINIDDETVWNEVIPLDPKHPSNRFNMN